MVSNVALPRPGDNYTRRQAVDERHADSGPLQALVMLPVDVIAPHQIDHVFDGMCFLSFSVSDLNTKFFLKPSDNLNTRHRIIVEEDGSRA